jgi:hypothetical protein
VLERADVEIPEERYIALWEEVGKSSPNIGQEIGNQTEPEDSGALGYALRSQRGLPGCTLQLTAD